MSSPPRRWVKKRAAADHLGVSERTIDAMVTDGRITAHRNGPGVVRFDLDELDASMQPSTPDPSKVDESIARLLRRAPELSDEQRSSIAALLRTGGAA